MIISYKPAVKAGLAALSTGTTTEVAATELWLVHVQRFSPCLGAPSLSLPSFLLDP